MGISMFNHEADKDVFIPVGSEQDGHINVGRKIVEVPVLIIGGGPAGLLQAYLLSRLGVRNLVIEQYSERLRAPKAHALSPRSLEICRQFGLDMGHIRSLGTPRSDAYWVNFMTTLSGVPLGRLPYERMDPQVLDSTPEMIHNIPQPDFEQYVAEELSKEECTDVRKGVSFVSSEQHASNSVTTVVEERTTGRLFKVRSKYVIACDGARSKVREYIGIKSDGEDSYEAMMTIHFQANLRGVVGDRVGMLHWLFDPLASGFIIAYNLEGNAVLITNFDSSKYPVEDWNESLCSQILKGAIGKDISLKILSHRPWILSRRVAEQYRKGNIFLAGDAAHSFPPTGGLGLNSGLADVHNLAFKIATVLNGTGADSLLDSYNQDRRHVAEVNSRQSVKNGRKIFSLLKTLGTADISDVHKARQNLLATIQDKEQMKKIDIGVEDQREHFDNLNLHIGYIYGDEDTPAHASHYKPSFIAGARLPHAWLDGPLPTRLPQLKPSKLAFVAELEPKEVETKTFSTLDLCAYNAWTLLLPEAGGDWGEVATQYSYLKLNILTPGEDFKILPNKAGKAWLRNSGLKAGQAILIRPDQHIFGTFRSEAEVKQLTERLARFLGR